MSAVDMHNIIQPLSSADIINYHYHFYHNSKTNIIYIKIEGIAEACLYWYLDDTSVVYLCNLNVKSQHRKKGIGLQLQILREQIGKNLNASQACLWVKKGSWMYEWYKRRGYSDYSAHSKNGFIWMIKQL